MISEGAESNLPPKSCTWRGQSRVSYKEYRFNMISTWIARWSLEIKGSSSKLRLTRSMNSVVKWEIIASFSYDLYLDHRMALGDRGWYLKWPRDELNQLVRNISCLKRDEGIKDFISWADRGEAYEAVSDQGPVWVRSEEKIPSGFESTPNIIFSMPRYSLVTQLSEEVWHVNSQN